MQARIALLFAVFLAAAAPAGAQLLSSPQDVVRCLCADRAVKMLGDEVAARKRLYDDTSQQLRAVELELERRRQNTNVEDAAAVDAFRERLDQRNALSARLSGELAADYETAVERYNRAVAAYNDGCVGRILDSGVVASVTPTLSCPVP
jgi:hypothetical protein